MGFPWGSDGKESVGNAKVWVNQFLGQEYLLEKKWLPTLVFLPGEFHGQGARWTIVHGVPKSQTKLND